MKSCLATVMSISFALHVPMAASLPKPRKAVLTGFTLIIYHPIPLPTRLTQFFYSFITTYLQQPNPWFAKKLQLFPLCRCINKGMILQNEPNQSHHDTATHRYKYTNLMTSSCVIFTNEPILFRGILTFNQAQSNPFSPPEDSKLMFPPAQKGGKLRSIRISERCVIRAIMWNHKPNNLFW